MTVAERYRYLYKPAVFLAGLAPFVLLTVRASGLGGSDLGADPVETLLDTCGKTALNFLLLTLLVTPVRHLTGWAHVLRLRRMLGLFAFFYAAVHFAIYAWLDLGLELATLAEEIAKRPYITVGFTALVLLVPLAVTSTNRMMRRLGRRWQRLHRLVYPIAILGVWHFWWQVKLDIREPLLYAVLLAMLLGWRLAHRLTSRTAPARARERVSRPAPSPDS